MKARDTDEEGIKQKQSMKIVADMMRKPTATFSMDAQNSWWFSDCQSEKHDYCEKSRQQLGEVVCKCWWIWWEMLSPWRDMRTKTKSGHWHWQCGTEVQHNEDKPRRNEELRSLGKGLPRLEENLKRAARSYKAATGVGCDWFHSKVPLDLQREMRGDILKFLKKLEQCGRLLQQACTTMFSWFRKTWRGNAPLRSV